MSGTGAPQEVRVDASGLRVAILAARWHAEVADQLLEGARAAAEECGAAVTTMRVPGTFELPVAAAAVAKQGYHAIVCLGVVVRGGTPHFDYVCRAVTDGCTRVALDYGVPVGFGVLTVDTIDQARERAHKGRDAALAALETAVALAAL